MKMSKSSGTPPNTRQAPYLNKNSGTKPPPKIGEVKPQTKSTRKVSPEVTDRPSTTTNHDNSKQMLHSPYDMKQDEKLDSNEINNGSLHMQEQDNNGIAEKSSSKDQRSSSAETSSSRKSDKTKQMITDSADYLGRVCTLMVMSVMTINSGVDVVSSLVQGNNWVGGIRAAIVFLLHLPLTLAILWILCADKVKMAYRAIKPRKNAEDEAITSEDTTANKEAANKDTPDSGVV